MVVLHVHTFLESGNSFPTPSEISERMTITEMKCMEVIQTLIQKVFITRRWTKIRSDDVRKLFFTTVMGKILHFLMDESIEEEQKEKTATSKFIYSI